MNSTFGMFKIGIGPSSSHTVGPMKAAKAFVDDLIEAGSLASVTRIAVHIHGSLALTGKGHHTDSAIILGLAGHLPETVDIAAIPDIVQDVETRQRIALALGRHEVSFPREQGITFHPQTLPLHENGMMFEAFAGNDVIYTKTYYSIGGGFIVEAEKFGQPEPQETPVPYPFQSAVELLAHCHRTGLSLSDIIMQNELTLHDHIEIKAYFHKIWTTMQGCMDRGMHGDGLLPGPLHVPRRAGALYRLLNTEHPQLNNSMTVIDWVNLFAFSVSEENAAGGRVVTAPTNGACGIIPAVLSYYDRFITPITNNLSTRFFLAAGAIGLLYKMNASISGAEVGCQGEVGVACSMAAAGLAELMGGSPEQVCIAAEIAMEHNLGLTCDPVAGLVQVPCIERNAIASIKAINAARMALHRESEPRVSLDAVIEAMYETGKDMDPKYRETSCGGLALKVACNSCTISGTRLT